MKKILATVLALVMALALCTTSWADGEGEGGTTPPASTTVVAKIGEQGYATLQAAVEAATTGQTIVLVADTTEDITVVSGKDITIDLSGKKVTNASADTITVALGAKLTITGTGTVDNVTHGKAAIYNNGTVILNGGSYTRSAEAENDTTTSGGNSYYNILNHGVMTINAAVEVRSSGHFSSLIANGYYTYTATDPRSGYVDGTNQAAPQLTINGGTFSGGINTVKNDDGGVMTINGGEFKNFTQACVQNHNKLTITNGNFDGSELKAIADSTVSVIYNCGCGADNDKGMLSISGGTFSGGKEKTYVICDVSTVNEAYTDISGGTFTKGSATMIGKTANAKVAISGGAFKDAAGKAVDVSAYLVAGKQQNSDGSVGNKSYYYYPSTTDTKTDTTTKGSPKTFDAGVGIYAVTAVLSLGGMAWTAKKRH